MINSIGKMQTTLNQYRTEEWSKDFNIDQKLYNDIELGRAKNIEVLDDNPSVMSFGQMLQDSISKVNTLQVNADTAVQRLASGKSNNLHETLLAVEQADIALKTMNQVRSKVLDAYKEIMRMQV